MANGKIGAEYSRISMFSSGAENIKIAKNKGIVAHFTLYLGTLSRRSTYSVKLCHGAGCSDCGQCLSRAHGPNTSRTELSFINYN
jgi:hypothetical protein